MQATISTDIHEVKVQPLVRQVTAPTPPRNVAVDAYRGLVMLLMMGEVMSFAKVARAFPHSLFWSILAYNQTHVEWAGMGLHDTIQPGFTFLRRRRATLLHSQPYQKRAELQSSACAHHLEKPPPYCARYLPALHRQHTNKLHLRRHTDPDRTGIYGCLPPGALPPELAVDRVYRPPLRLLAGVGALSGSRSRLQLRRRGRFRGLAPQLHRLRLSLEQEQQPWPGVRRLVPQHSPPAFSLPLQRGRLSHLEFHPHTGHHAPRPPRR